ncbi:MAG: ABC transporter ATP-binding protein [Gammaproteobacteria bacterium]|nr:ABC transporter ATP-binding protein [Gammaproteobacteria bacterium]
MSLCVTQLKTHLHNNNVPALNLNCASGQLVGIVGSNGAGKSTFLKLIAGVLEPTDGDVTLSNVSLLEKSREFKSRIGYCPDVLPVISELTVALFLKIAVIAKLNLNKNTDIATTLNDLLTKFNLIKLANKSMSQLSLGERQRLNLAQALCNNPELLILDEPLNGLDPSQQELFWEHTQNKTGLKIIASHHFSELLDKCDRLIIIEQHKIVTDITLSSHQYLYVLSEEFIGNDISNQNSSTTGKLDSNATIESASFEYISQNRKILGFGEPPSERFVKQFPTPILEGPPAIILHQLFKLVAQGKWQW